MEYRRLWPGFVAATFVLCSACGSSDSGGGSGGTGGSAGTGGSGGSGATGGSGGSAGAGTGGACTNATDQPKLQTQATADDASSCGTSCLTKAAGAERSQCAADCMKQKQGFTAACSTCWGQVIDCGITKCITQCISPTSAGCKTCTDQNCTPAFNTCALGQ